MSFRAQPGQEKHEQPHGGTTQAGPEHREPAGVRARPGQLAGGVGRELHDLVRGDVLDLPRDPFGARHRPDRRHLPRRHGQHRHLVRQPRRPPPQAGRDPGVGRGVVRVLRPGAGPVPRDTGVRVARRGEPHALGVRGGADARRDRRQPARDRVAHPRHPAGAGGGARPCQRPGRHGVRPVVPGDLGDQRPARGLRRHALGARTGAPRDGRVVPARVAADHPGAGDRLAERGRLPRTGASTCEAPSASCAACPACSR